VQKGFAPQLIMAVNDVKGTIIHTKNIAKTWKCKVDLGLQN
jgi:hypothetical protein